MGSPILHPSSEFLGKLVDATGGAVRLVTRSG